MYVQEGNTAHQKPEFLHIMYKWTLIKLKKIINNMLTKWLLEYNLLQDTNSSCYWSSLYCPNAGNCSGDDQVEINCEISDYHQVIAKPPKHYWSLWPLVNFLRIFHNLGKALPTAERNVRNTFDCDADIISTSESYPPTDNSDGYSKPENKMWIFSE